MTHVFTRLAYEIDGGVADVRLGAEDGSSLADEHTAADLLELATRLAEDESVRAVLLRARGRDFTSGGNIEMFHALRETGLAAGLRRMLDDYHRAIERFAALDAPIVAGVRGAAAGGGLGLVCMADVVIGAQDSIYTMGASAIGLSADGGTSWYLPRLVGLRRAQELVLLNRRLTADEALDWGLITAVEPPERVDDAARALAERIAAGPTRAYGQLRRLLRDSAQTSLVDQLSDEARALVVAAGTDDAAEGVAAFSDRRRPRFTGR